MCATQNCVDPLASLDTRSWSRLVIASSMRNCRSIIVYYDIHLLAVGHAVSGVDCVEIAASV